MPHTVHSNETIISPASDVIPRQPDEKHLGAGVTQLAKISFVAVNTFGDE